VHIKQVRGRTKHLGAFIKLAGKQERGRKLQEGRKSQGNSKAKIKWSWLLYQVSLCYFLVANFS
jgi:hypothetical protein